MRCIELFESADMQSGFAMMADRLLDAWATRIIKFARDRSDNPIIQPYDLAAGTFADVFKNNRYLNKFPESLRNFVKQSIKHHVRLVTSLQTDDTSGHYFSNGAIPSTNGRQPEIYLYFPSSTFNQYVDGIRDGKLTAARDLLNTRRSTFDHELRHAYDDFVSAGRYRRSPQTKQAQLDTERANREPTVANKERAQRSYLRQPHEISARYQAVVAAIQPYVHGAWKDYALTFKFNLGGWQKLPPKTQRRLLRRLATEWTHVHGRPPIDITPFIDKLKGRFGRIWVSVAHGNIEVSGLTLATADQQAAALRQIVYLADIFRRQVVTYDTVPMLKDFGFVANKGRNIDYIISAPYRRQPRVRRAAA